jgi:quercetin dioxygenase-like cupin family protein
VVQGPLDTTAPFAIRATIPAKYDLPAHWHPGIENVTIMSGTFNLGMGDKLDKSKTTPLPAGSFFSMPPKMNHYAWTETETVLQINGIGPWGLTYVDPALNPKK